MENRRYRNGSHQVRGNARRPFRYARRIQKLANSAAVHYSLLPVPCSDDTATVYYNYRHYEPVTERWMSRDPIGECGDGILYVFVKNNVPRVYDRYGLMCCQDFLDKVEGVKPDSDPYGVDYNSLRVELNVAGIQKERYCKIKINCKVCKSDASRSGEQTSKRGSASYKKGWFDPFPVIDISICTDESGRTLRDESATKSTLMHELPHAKDLCKAGHGFTCGDFTVDSVNLVTRLRVELMPCMKNALMVCEFGK